MKAEIAGIFGPVSDTSRGYVQSLAQTFLIPHINAVWDSRTEREYFSVNVYPDHEVLSGAYADLIKYFGWKDFTVIYDDNDSKCTGFLPNPNLTTMVQWVEALQASSTLPITTVLVYIGYAKEYKTTKRDILLLLFLTNFNITVNVLGRYTYVQHYSYQRILFILGTQTSQTQPNVMVHCYCFKETPVSIHIKLNNWHIHRIYLFKASSLDVHENISIKQLFTLALGNAWIKWANWTELGQGWNWM